MLAHFNFKCNTNIVHIAEIHVIGSSVHSSDSNTD